MIYIAVLSNQDRCRTALQYSPCSLERGNGNPMGDFWESHGNENSHVAHNGNRNGNGNGNNAAGMGIAYS